MTSFKINLKDMIASEPSRASAVNIRKEILNLLKVYDTVQLDLKNVNFTPSVADEIIGVLATELGAVIFKQKIHLINVSESQKALMSHVVARRLINSEKSFHKL
ncbi:STAS-like domain-containing protein [Legionella pneumophila]|uniref:STAS-like domain-containing protein n=1 Tax=Legionella pneumophila TaxID=446 RepID=UPI00077A4CAE|nr:STAS-like domain-containing protein [Legionella pneumophila]